MTDVRDRGHGLCHHHVPFTCLCRLQSDWPSPPRLARLGHYLKASPLRTAYDCSLSSLCNYAYLPTSTIGVINTSPKSRLTSVFHFYSIWSICSVGIANFYSFERSFGWLRTSVIDSELESEVQSLFLISFISTPYGRYMADPFAPLELLFSAYSKSTLFSHVRLSWSPEFESEAQSLL